MCSTPNAAGRAACAARDLLPSPDDVQVSPALVRGHGLRRGDLVDGVAGRPGALAEVRLVNGLPPHRDAGRTSPS